VILLVLAYCLRLYQDNSPLNGNGFWMAFTDSWVVDSCMEWFPMNLIKTGDLPGERRYIFGVHPHGVIPFGIHPVGKSSLWAKLFPGVHVRYLVASIIFKIPVAREIALWSGGVDASHLNAKKVLQSGLNVAVFPGGSAELLESTFASEVLILRERKGFIRLALETGSSLVPVYGFGVNDLYNQISICKELRMKILKKTKVALTFATGRYFFNLLPAKTPIHVVVGQPIAVQKNETPSDEEVDSLHQQYIDSLVKIYNTHKKEFGFGDRELIIK